MTISKNFSYAILFISVIIFSTIPYTNQKWPSPITPSHKFNPSVHSQLSQSIRQVILQNIDSFQDPDWVQQFKADLNQSDDSKRKLKQISAKNVDILFGIFSMKNPGCDQNQDGIVKDKELKCLDKIWKYYVPSG